MTTFDEKTTTITTRLRAASDLIAAPGGYSPRYFFFHGDGSTAHFPQCPNIATRSIDGALYTVCGAVEPGDAGCKEAQDISHLVETLIPGWDGQDNITSWEVRVRPSQEVAVALLDEAIKVNEECRMTFGPIFDRLATA